MKFAKVEIDKTGRSPAETKFVYPNGYDPKVVSPIMYQNEGLDSESCIASVPDDFAFTAQMTELSKVEAEALIDAWAESDKDFKDGGELSRDDVKSRKKAHLG